MIKCQEKEDTLSERVMNFMKKRAIGAKDVTSIHAQDGRVILKLHGRQTDTGIYPGERVQEGARTLWIYQCQPRCPRQPG